MTPREQLRKMTSLGEQGAMDDKHWYRMVHGMAAGELRQRQELMLRTQMMAPQILAQGQRLQGSPHFDPRFMEREMVPPTEMVPSEARQMQLGAHLATPMPPHAGAMPGRGFPAAGYRFLPSEPMETVARRQELIHKQNIARMEMNAILQQKELESAHQKGLLGLEGVVYPPPMAYRGRQRLPDGHDVFVHRTTLEDLQTNSLLLSSSPAPYPHSPAPYPHIPALRERGRRPGRRTNHKSQESHVTGPKGQSEDKGVEQSPGTASGEDKEAEGKGDGEAAGGKTRPTKMDAELAAGGRKSYKEAEPGLHKSQDGCPDGPGGGEKDPGPCSAFQEKFLYPSPGGALGGGALGGLPYLFPPPGNGLFPPGPANLFLNGDDVSLEDIRKWSVDDVSAFIASIPSCTEYTQTFKEHMIDGETLPLLTEEHLLDTLGLKLGPALKIRSQVSRRLGNTLYMMNLPLPGHAPPAAAEKASDCLSELGSPAPCPSVELMGSPAPRDPDLLRAAEPLPETDPASPPGAAE